MFNSIIDRRAWIPRASTFNVLPGLRDPRRSYIESRSIGLTARSLDRESVQRGRRKVGRNEIERNDRATARRGSEALIKGTYCH